MKAKSILTLLIALLAGPAYGQSLDGGSTAEGGNGGGAWVCRSQNESGPIRWLQLLDLFEGRTYDTLTFNAASSLSLEANLERAATRFAQAFPQYTTDGYLLNEAIADVRARTHLVDATLELTDDWRQDFQPRADTCRNGVIRRVQVANFRDQVGTSGELAIDEVLFDRHLDDLGRSTLFVHEATYRWLRGSLGLRRGQRERTSSLSRRLTGHLMSDASIEAVAAILPQTPYERASIAAAEDARRVAAAERARLEQLERDRAAASDRRNGTLRFEMTFSGQTLLRNTQVRFCMDFGFDEEGEERSNVCFQAVRDPTRNRFTVEIRRDRFQRLFMSRLSFSGSFNNIPINAQNPMTMTTRITDVASGYLYFDTELLRAEASRSPGIPIRRSSSDTYLWALFLY